MNVIGSLTTLIIYVIMLTSCKTLEKASIHGLTSGYYTMRSIDKNGQDIYLDVNDESLDIYNHTKSKIDKDKMFTIPLQITDSIILTDMFFKKQSLDIDITSILLKYRPSVSGLPSQMNTDLNIAIYSGWRYDQYNIKFKKDPLGRYHPKIGNLGYDVGFFAGTGTTMINGFTTNNKRIDEYSGMIIQYGIAGFLESNVASFGLSLGYDHLLGADRKIWIYHKKPCIGFVVGIALN